MAAGEHKTSWIEII